MDWTSVNHNGVRIILMTLQDSIFVVLLHTTLNTTRIFTIAVPTYTVNNKIS